MNLRMPVILILLLQSVLMQTLPAQTPAKVNTTASNSTKINAKKQNSAKLDAKRIDAKKPDAKKQSPVKSDLKAQSPVRPSVGDQAQRARSAMQASVEKQRISVQQQAQAMGISKPAAASPFASLIPHPQSSCGPLEQPELEKLIGDVALQQQIDAALIREVARQESNFYPCVISPKGAAGLMQLMPETQARFQVSDPLNPLENINAGARLLKQLMERYHGELPLALAAYNAGTMWVDRSLKVPAIPETNKYVIDILGRLHQ